MESVKLDYKIHWTRDMYIRLNNIKDGHIKKKKFIRNIDGFLITTSEKISKKWGGIFQLAA